MAKRPSDGPVQRTKNKAVAKDRASSDQRTKRAVPPVSTATGGPMPGIDLNDTAVLQEMDDLAYSNARRRRR